MKHTAACLKGQEARRTWEAQYPNFCRKCDGTGYHIFQATYSEPSYEEPCSACYCEGICPRCGQEMVSIENDNIDAAQICPACQWTDKEFENIPFPPQPECECWQDPENWEPGDK